MKLILAFILSIFMFVSCSVRGESCFNDQEILIAKNYVESRTETDMAWEFLNIECVSEEEKYKLFFPEENENDSRFARLDIITGILYFSKHTVEQYPSLAKVSFLIHEFCHWEDYLNGYDFSTRKSRTFSEYKCSAKQNKYLIDNGQTIGIHNFGTYSMKPVQDKLEVK